MTWDELPASGATLLQRLFQDDLPPPLLAPSKQPSFYREWIDSFFAREIQRLFGFRDISRFNALLEYLLRQSGGEFEVTKTASAGHHSAHGREPRARAGDPGRGGVPLLPALAGADRPS